MKTPSHRTREARHLQLYAPRHDDPYRDAGKPVQDARCPSCGVVFRDGRWTWGRAPKEAVATMCPACLRIQDRFPGGYVTLKGPFVQAHRDELRQLVQAREAHEKAEHPLERVMEIGERAEALEITTTGNHLARAIGNAVRAAYEGSLKVRYEADENLVRAVWTR
ncbi:MAG: BCAM0308 family protein [Burkholderiales bacterium]|mgnify:CR=1 FL=1